jgi:long-chain acyl-CoA synthetase
MVIGDLTLQCARRYPDKVAMVFEGQSRTYGEFNERVNALAHSLAQAGLKAGDKVGVLSRNNIEMFEICFAAAKTGMVWVPLNFRLVPAELRFVINDAELGILFVGDSFTDVVAAIRGEIDVPHVIPLGPQYEDMIASSSTAEPDANVTPDDLFAIFYTSGTTGGPKGVMLTHDNFLSAVINHVIAYKLGPYDVSLHVQPCYHTMEASMVLSHMYVGATNVMVVNFNGHEFWKLVESEKITNITLVYTGLVDILDAYEEGGYKLGTLRSYSVGGQTTPVPILQRAVRVLGPDIVFVVYGLTEASPLLTYLPKEDMVLEGEHQRRMGSVGKELFNCHVRVVDGDDKDVKPGEMGEIIARGPNVMKGYWKRPEDSAAALKAGWLRTGDVGTVDDEGYVYVVDRKKDLIISGGENISPHEVEDVLHMHPAIHECAVVGVPDERWGEQVKAVIVLRKGEEASEQEIIRFCSDHLARYKMPRSIDFVDALPKDPVGKIQKRLIRDRYWPAT